MLSLDYFRKVSDYINDKWARDYFRKVSHYINEKWAQPPRPSTLTCPADAQQRLGWAREPVVWSDTALPWPNIARPGWALQVVYFQPIVQAHQWFFMIIQ